MSERSTGSSGVVVGYDGSPSGAPALAWASSEAARRSSPLTVLFAADYGEAYLRFGDELEELAVRTAEDGAAQARELLGAGTQVPVRASWPLERASVALVEASRTAELLVVGNRGRGPLVGALLGSVAFAVSASAHCPVVVVRAGEHGSPPPAPGPSHPVVVGVDGSPGGGEAVDVAAQAAERADAPLRVLAAWMTPPVVDSGFAVDIYQELADAAERAARDAAKAAADAARSIAPGIGVEEVVVQQPARLALTDASRGAGLVVVGARGHGSVAGLFLGSVSHAAIHGAHCPVLVVRRPH